MIIALAQINPTIGDIRGNADRIIARIGDAVKAGADMVVFPELATIGYPPKDLLLKQSLIRANLESLDRIAKAARGIVAIVGYVQPHEADRGRGLFNMAAICADGRVVARHAKSLLPMYDVFDECRYFDPAGVSTVSRVQVGDREIGIGVTICEDLWSDDSYLARQLYERDPADELAKAGAELIVNIGASPFSLGKQARRNALFGEKARQMRATVVAVNQVGGDDDLIFDGGSAVYDCEGRVIAQAKSFAEDFLLVDPAASDNRIEPLPGDVQAIHDGLVLGTRDYVDKCGFGGVVVGVSGGIDSAVTAAIAAEALGKDRLHLVAMPSRYSSAHSLEDAQALASSLDVPMRTVSIEGIHGSVEAALKPEFDGRPSDVTEENIQARARGVILMALSNKFSWLLLTTGNKSELAVGYCTLYGDMCGGLAVLSDVPKTLVYRLADYINERDSREIIPQSTITKPPSAELREHQTDQDTLPQYDVLDAILERYIESEQSADQIIAEGFDEREVGEVLRMVDLNEYKRKQAPVGLKVTSRAFGTGRRMPIAAKYS